MPLIEEYPSIVAGLILAILGGAVVGLAFAWVLKLGLWKSIGMIVAGIVSALIGWIIGRSIDQLLSSYSNRRRLR